MVDYAPGRKDKIPGWTFAPQSRAGYFRLPHNLNDGLEIFHIMFEGFKDAKRNWAKDKDHAIKLGAGTPVDVDNGVQFTSGSVGLRTAMLDVYASTTYACISTDTSPAPGSSGLSRFFHMGSSAGNNDSNGFNLFTSYNSSAPNIRINSRYTNGTSTNLSSTTGDPSLAWGLRMGRSGTAAEDGSFKNLSSGAFAPMDVPAGYARVNNGQPVTIGSEQSGAWGGVGQVALAMGWSRFLSADDELYLHDWLTDFVAANTSLTI